MAAPENERSGAIETVEEWKPPVPLPGGKKRHDQKAKGKDRQCSDRLGPVRKPGKHFWFFRRRLTRISLQPTSAPSAIVSTCTQELLVNRMITAATKAKEIRVLVRTKPCRH